MSGCYGYSGPRVQRATLRPCCFHAVFRRSTLPFSFSPFDRCGTTAVVDCRHGAWFARLRDGTVVARNTQHLSMLLERFVYLHARADLDVNWELNAWIVLPYLTLPHLTLPYRTAHRSQREGHAEQDEVEDQGWSVGHCIRGAVASPQVCMVHKVCVHAHRHLNSCLRYQTAVLFLALLRFETNPMPPSVVL